MPLFAPVNCRNDDVALVHKEMHKDIPVISKHKNVLIVLVCYHCWLDHAPFYLDKARQVLESLFDGISLGFSDSRGYASFSLNPLVSKLVPLLQGIFRYPLSET